MIESYGRVKLTASFPIITQQFSESKFARLGLAKRTRTSGAEGLLTSLVSLVAGHAGVAFLTLADLASWLSPHVTEIFGDYPHGWGLRNHFGDGTIRPPELMSKMMPKWDHHPPNINRQGFPRLRAGPAHLPWRMLLIKPT